MYAVVLLGFLALAGAAPHYGYHHHDHYERFPHSFESELDGYLRQNVFDTRRFWEDLQRDMMQLDTMLADLGKHFPSSVSSEKIEGNEYVITIPLTGYREDEIAIKARKGLLVVQAVHKVDGESQRNYLDVRTLPDCANEAGSWTFDKGILRITFPLHKDENTDVVTEAVVTDAPQHSREEMEPHDGNSKPNNDDNIRGDIDVRGVPNPSDIEVKTKVLTNEFPKRTPVEATTYAVDLKGEVELLPAQF